MVWSECRTFYSMTSRLESIGHFERLTFLSMARVLLWERIWASAVEECLVSSVLTWIFSGPLLRFEV